jgi:CubicO group peptidase (beta-lactamase class C family)
MADANEAVRQVIARAVAEGQEIGIQVAAYLDGRLVVDAWGGLADETTGRPVDGDTLFPVFSATKGVAATALHLQAERGLVEYDRPIAHYWPEFGVKGKERATVRDALVHRVGIPQMPEGTTPELMCDWEHMVRAVAELEPLWEPGTRSGYHAYTFGWIVGEIVRRTDPARRPFGRFVQEEVCAPLGLDSLFLGIPDAVEPRVAKLTNAPPPPPGAPALPPDALLFRAIPPHLGTNQETFGRPDVRRSCHPAAGGIMNARSLARHYAMLAGGGALDGVRLLSPERVAMLYVLQSDETDAVIGTPYRRGLGYWLGGEPPAGVPGAGSAMGRNPHAFGHPGAGGSVGWADPDARLAVAIVRNRMRGAPTGDWNPILTIAETIRTELGVPG